MPILQAMLFEIINLAVQSKCCGLHWFIHYFNVSVDSEQMKHSGQVTHESGVPVVCCSDTCQAQRRACEQELQSLIKSLKKSCVVSIITFFFLMKKNPKITQT